METQTNGNRPYMPSVDDCKFFTEAEGKRFAVGAGFVVFDDDSPAVATREDLPGSSFVLQPTGNKWEWVRE